MKNDMHAQAGASTLATIMVLLCAALLLVFAVKIIPIYVDDYTVRGLLENLQEDEETRTLTVRQLQERIQRRMSVNNVEVIDAKDIKLVQDGQRMSMAVAYEVRTSLFQNIDAVVHFDHQYEWITQ
jgi:hypothetical protein